MFNRESDGAAAEPMTVAQFQTALGAISRDHGRAENFRHFMEAAYCSRAKLTAADAERVGLLEARLRAVEQAYGNKREIMARIAQLQTRLVIAVTHYRGDFLEEACVTGGLSNDRLDPRIATYEIAEQVLRKSLQQRDVTALLSKGRPITLHEASSGAGARILAMAAHLESMGFDPERALFATLITNNPLAYQMAFLQMSVRGIPALCICADTLKRQEFDRACTVAAIHLRQWLAARGERSPVLLGQCAPGHAASSDGPSAKPAETAAQRTQPQTAASATPASRAQCMRPRPKR